MTTSTTQSGTEKWTNPLRNPHDMRLPRIAGPCSLVIFGVTGDLSKKKLIPAVYDLANRGLLPAGFGLVGFGRREWSHEDFADFIKQNIIDHARTEFNESTWEYLKGGIRFVQGTFDDADSFKRLSDTVSELDDVR